MSSSKTPSPTNKNGGARQSGTFSEGRKVYNFLQIIDDVDAKNLFMAFLKRCRNEDSLVFVEEVHNFLILSSPVNRFTAASRIMAEYIEFESPHELNLSVEMRKRLITEFSKCDHMYCPRDLFEKVYNQMLIQLQLDSFPRFIQTEDFNKWVAKMKKDNEQFENQFMELFELHETAAIKSYTSQVKMIESKEAAAAASEYDRPAVSINFKSEDLIESLASYNSAQLVQLVQDMMDVETGIQISKVKTPSVFDKVKLKKQLFSGEELIQWLKHYLNKESTNEMIKLAELFIKYEILGIEKKTPELSGCTLFFKLKKKLVLLGIGFANATIVKELENDFDITMIDIDPNWEYNVSYHLLFGDPNRIKGISIPMYRLSKKSSFVLGTAEFITPKVVGVKGENEQITIVPYDYLIVGTGCSYRNPFPIEIDEAYPKKPAIIMPYSSSSILNQLKQLQEATKVVVIGSGPVAMECGLEIVHYYKKAEVTFVTQSSTFLERAAPICHNYIYKYISTLNNVNVKFNRRVVEIKNNKLRIALNDVRHDAGVIEELEADVILLCVGFKPNTECFVPYLSNSLDINGFAITNDKFQLVRYTDDHSSLLNLPSLKTEVARQSTDSSSDDSLSEVNERDGDLEQSDWPILLDIFKPNTGESALAKRNNTSTFFKNIFAVGDIVSSAEERLCYIARFHANFLSNYLMNYEIWRKPQDEMKTFSYAPMENIRQAMSLGPKNGIIFKDNKIVFKGRVVNVTKDAFELNLMKSLKG